MSAAALVAAVPPAGSRLVEVTRVESAVVTMRIVGSTLLAVAVAGGPRLTAYRLDDGARRWTVPLPLSGLEAPASAIDVVDGVALVSNGEATVAVDISSGQELWHSDIPRAINVRIPHAIVVETYSVSADETSTAASTSRAAWVRALNARTGQQIWEYPAPAGWLVTLPYVVDGTDPASTFVVSSLDGGAIAVDLATGQALTSGQIESPVTAPAGQGEEQQEWRYQIYGNQLLVYAGSRLTAYALGTLAWQWTVAVPGTDASLTGCGPWLCLDDGATLRALARGTGTPAWSMPRGSGQPSLAWVRQWIYRGPVPGDPGDASLFEPVAQRVVLDLGNWRLAAQADTPAVLRLDGGRSGLTWIGLLTEGLQVEPLGAVTALNQQPCAVGGPGYLACLTVRGDLRIWRYQP